MKIKERAMAYDVIRTIAILMIVMVHVSAYIIIYVPNTTNAEWSIGNLFNGISRAGVPMFIMLSGALLLNEDKPFDTKRFFKKNFLTIALLTFGWIAIYGLFYAVFLPLLEGKPVAISVFFRYLFFFQGTDYAHLWYMLMAIGLYLMIPVFRLFVKRKNRSYVLGIIVASIIFQFGATTADFFSRNYFVSVSDMLGRIHLEPATGYMGLLLLGWYLSEFTLKKRTRFILYIAGIVAVTTSTLLVYSMIDTVPEIRNYMYEAFTLPAFIYGAALFVLIQSCFDKKLSDGNPIAIFSDCSFGIYLVHVIVLETFVKVILSYEDFGKSYPLAYIAILYAFVLVVSFSIVKLTGYVKGLRKIFFNR